MFQSIKAMRVSDQIVNQIQCMVVENKLADGQKLPNETELSQQFGVSRASVREALSILEAKGVLERHKSGGTFVCRYCLEKILAAIDIPRKRTAKCLTICMKQGKSLRSRLASLPACGQINST